MQRSFVVSGAILGGVGVGLGAFGAHALRPMLEAAQRMETFETAVKYQFYHALALLVIGLLLSKTDNRLIQYSGYLMFWGTLVFSGSLYVLCFTGIRWLGAITPVGGVLMIAGWALLAWAAKSSPEKGSKK